MLSYGIPRLTAPGPLAALQRIISIPLKVEPTWISITLAKGNLVSLKREELMFRERKTWNESGVPEKTFGISNVGFRIS
jgi:hypothetical protein